MPSEVVRLILTGLCAAGLLGVGAAPAAADTLKVPQQFDTIQDAVDAADEGDTVLIKDGTYEEGVEVTTNNLTIKGQSLKTFVNAEGTGDEVFDVDADGVKISTLRARNGETDGIACTGDRCRVSHVVVEGDTSDDCVDILGDDGVVEKSRLIGCGGLAIVIDGNGAKLASNTIRLIGEGCIDVDGDDVQVLANQIRNCEDEQGILVVGGRALVRGNDVRSTDSHPIEVTGENPVVVNNVASNSEADIFEIVCSVDCSSGRLEGNRATGNSNDDEGFDVSVTGTGTFRILDNVSQANNQAGFDITMDDGVVRGNRASKNGAESEEGILVSGDRNTIANNSADRNGGNGITIEGDSNENVVRNNTVSRNNFDGIEIDDSGGEPDDTVLDGNVASKNVGDGLDNEGTNTDVIDNRSSNSGGVDCANDGTIDEDHGNKCEDGSDFTVAGTIDAT